MNLKKFAVIGGDQRNIALAKLLLSGGHNVGLYGFSNYDKENLEMRNNLYETVEGADYIVGPIPCSHNGNLLNTAFHHSDIYVEDIFRLIKPNQVFLAGYMKEELLALASKYNVRTVDMLAREELLLLNAIPIVFSKKVFFR